VPIRPKRSRTILSRRPPSPRQTCLPPGWTIRRDILANVADLSEAHCTTLSSISGAAAGSWFPWRESNQRLQRTTLPPFPVSSRRSRTARGEADQDEKYFTLQDKNYDHSIVSIWNDPASGTLGSARFYRAFQLLLSPTPKSRTPAFRKSF